MTPWPPGSKWQWPPASSPWVWPPPLPTAPSGPPIFDGAAEWWDSELDCDASAWVGQLAGTSLAGFNAPTVAVDSTFFSGRPVAQGTELAAGGAYWAGTLAASLIPAGSPVWSYTIARLRGPVGLGVSQVLYTAWAQTFCDTLIAYLGKWHSYSLNNLVDSGVLADYAPHRFILSCDGVNSKIVVDGTSAQGAFATLGTVPINDVYMNKLGSSFDYRCPVSIAFRILSPVIPSASEIAALDSYCSSRYDMTI